MASFKRKLKLHVERSYVRTSRDRTISNVHVLEALHTSAQLSSTTLWSAPITEVRGKVDYVMFQEACGLWLDGKEASSTESDELFKQWTNFGELLLIGNFLQSQVLDMVVSPLQRQKRQAINGIDYNTTYNLVMGDMRAKFLENSLSEEQKEEASLTIRETQNILADYSLEVLGIERESMTLEETSAVLAEAKASGDMTLTQHALIQGYGVDTQVSSYY